MIPDDKTSVTSFSVIQNKMKEQLRVIVNEPIATGDIEPFQNVKNLYKACMNTDVIEALGKAPVETILNQMGGWPVATGTLDSTWTWQRSAWLSRERGYSVSYFLSFSVSTDNKDSTKRIIRVSVLVLNHLKDYLRPFIFW